MENYKLIPYSCIVVVSGYKNATLIDTQRMEVSMVPRWIGVLIQDAQMLTYQELLVKHSHIPDLDKVIERLIEDEICFYISKAEEDFFPPFTPDWDAPSMTTNAILDIERITEDVFLSIDKLDAINTLHLQLRFFEPLLIDEIERVVEHCNKYSFKTLDVHLDARSVSRIDAISLGKRYSRINIISMYGSGHDEVEELAEMIFSLQYSSTLLNDEKHCGKIKPEYFSLFVGTISEAHHFNTCLNRKISVDRQGYVRNCPSMPHQYGHISEVNLKDVVAREDFRFWWGLKKDDIEVCRDCEFRYICTDCRAYLKNPENLLSQPAKCGYNPYIGKWNHEEGYVTVEQWRADVLKMEAGE